MTAASNVVHWKEVEADRKARQARWDDAMGGYYERQEDRREAKEKRKEDYQQAVIDLAAQGKEGARKPRDTSLLQAAAKPVSLDLSDLSQLDCAPLEREYLVSEWLSFAVTTILYGDGGTGKTLLAQQLMMSAGLGLPWLGLPVAQCKSLGLFCEDDLYEVHRRAFAICKSYGRPMADLGDMRVVCAPGEDSSFVTFDRSGAMAVTPLYEAFKAAAIDFGARLIVIDGAACTFPGNENDRGQVTRFLGLLNRLATDTGAAVVLLAHPSRTGLAQAGDLDGGSTAWNNAVRARLALTRPKDAPADTTERVLSLRKSNYGAKGTELRMRWQGGAFMPPPVGTVADALEAVNRDMEAESVFLALLDRFTATGKRLSDSKNATNFAPKMFAVGTDAKGFRRQDFARAMERLFVAGTLKLGAYGRKGDARQMIVRTDAPQPGDL